MMRECPRCGSVWFDPVEDGDDYFDIDDQDQCLACDDEVYHMRLRGESK